MAKEPLTKVCLRSEKWVTNPGPGVVACSISFRHSAVAFIYCFLDSVFTCKLTLKMAAASGLKDLFLTSSAASAAKQRCLPTLNS